MKLQNTLITILSVILLTSCGNEADIIKDGTMKHYPQAHIGDVLESNFDNTDWSVEEKNGTTYVTFSGKITEDLHNKAVKNLNQNFRALIALSHFSSMPSKNNLSISYYKQVSKAREEIKKDIFEQCPWLKSEQDYIDGKLWSYVTSSYKKEVLNKIPSQPNSQIIKEFQNVRICSSNQLQRINSIRLNVSFTAFVKSNLKSAEFTTLTQEMEKLNKELKAIISKMPNTVDRPNLCSLNIFLEKTDKSFYEKDGKEYRYYSLPRMLITCETAQKELATHKAFKSLYKKYAPLKVKICNFTYNQSRIIDKELAEAEKLIKVYTKSLLELQEKYNQLQKSYEKRLAALAEKYGDGISKSQVSKSINKLLMQVKKNLKEEFISKYIQNSYWAPEERCTITWTLFADEENFKIKSMNADSWGHNKFTVNDVFDVIYSN